MKAFRCVIVMIAVMLALCGTARAGLFNDANDGNWTTAGDPGHGVANTWGAGTGTVPGVDYPWDTAPDTALIDSNKVIFNVNIPAGVSITLAGGELEGHRKDLGLRTVNAPINVTADSTLDGRVAKADPTSSAFNTIAGNITGTGKLSLENNGNRIRLSTTNNSSFSGGWDLNNSHLVLRWPSGSVGTGSQVFGTGSIESDGGGLRFHQAVGGLPNDFLLGGGGMMIETNLGGGLGTGSATLLGQITGTGMLDLQCENSIVVVNAANSYGSLQKRSGGMATFMSPGSLGGGSLSVIGGKLFLDNAGGLDWGFVGTDLTVNGGVVEYDTIVRNITVGALTLGATPFGPGVYDIAAISGGEDFSDYFNGVGTVTVGAPSGAIPEPAGLGVLGLAALAFCRRKRRRRSVVRMAMVAALVGVLAMSGTARADLFSSQMSGNWNCKAIMHYTDWTDYDVWGQGIGATGNVDPVPDPVEAGVNFPWSGDTGVVNAGHTVKWHTAPHAGWFGTRVDAPADLTVVLDGGTLGFAPESSYDDVSAPILVKSASSLAPESINDDGYDQRGGISDYDGANTGKLTVVGSGKDMSLSGNQSGFSGGWDIGSNNLWFGAWEGAPGAGDGCMGTGAIEVDGGSLRFHYNAGTLNNAIVLGPNGCEVEDGRGDLGTGTVTFAGEISGEGTLTVDGDYADRIRLTNPNSSYGGLLMIGSSSMVVEAPGALGLLTTVQSGILKLDNYGASWDCSVNDLVITGGKVQYNTGVTNLTVHSLTLGTDTFADGTYDIALTHTSIEGNPVDFTGYFIGASTVTVDSGGAIPEPAGLSLVGLALLGLRRRRSRS